MSKTRLGKSSVPAIIASVAITLIIGSGAAYLALPVVYPSLTPSKTNEIVQTAFTTWQDESFIFDNDLTWEIMNKTQVNFTISENSQISASFSAPFLMSLDASFNSLSRYEVSLVIENVGNTSLPIIFYDDSGATGFYRQLSFFPTLFFMSDVLPAGTYNCSIQWKSSFDSPSSVNSLSVSHHNTNSVYHYDRWLRLQEIRS